jgi:hypothetical protein
MGHLQKTKCGYEYISNNGIVYDIGENGADFNIIIDTFLDVEERFEAIAPLKLHLVDYVFGDIEDENVLEWIDERIQRYEHHERTIRLYADEPIECYIGLQEEQYETPKKISRDELLKLIDNNTK